MLLLKTSKKTIGQVVETAKHATHTRPDAQQNDVVLIAQTKSTLELGQKSIRYIMTFKSCRVDVENESMKIWGKKWRYIIDGADVVEIPGFNIEEVQVSGMNYDPIVTHRRLEPDDEEAVLSYLSKGTVIQRARTTAAESEAEESKITEELNMLTSHGVDTIITKSKRYFRDPRISALLKSLYRYKCQICGIRIVDAFGRPYAETHHIKKRSEQGEDNPNNMLVLCPNHHKMFALGSARIDIQTKTILVNGEKVSWENKHF